MFGFPAHRHENTFAWCRMVVENKFINLTGIALAVFGQFQMCFSHTIRMLRSIDTESISLNL